MSSNDESYLADICWTIRDAEGVLLHHGVNGGGTCAPFSTDK